MFTFLVFGFLTVAKPPNPIGKLFTRPAFQLIFKTRLKKRGPHRSLDEGKRGQAWPPAMRLPP
jgi:hypothetical protein